MYINEDGEYVTVHRGEDEAGPYIEYRTYQDNGWIRVNREYNDCTTETFIREEEEWEHITAESTSRKSG